MWDGFVHWKNSIVLGIQNSQLESGKQIIENKFDIAIQHIIIFIIC